MLDVLIQTYNEELNLPHTLESLRGWVNRVFVVDSGSTDRTREIAEAYGATVAVKSWEGYARQKNWAIDHLPFESPWILILDADESVSPNLRKEIAEVADRPVENVRQSAFYINRVMIFMGREIRHCAYFPAWNLRLFKRGLARYEEREVHEHMTVQGPTAYLKNLLLHEDRRGLEHFIAKHNRYSTLEAIEIYRQRERWPGFKRFINDRVARRRYIKYRLAPKLAMPWFARFVYMYFFRGGILDRRPGLTLCLLLSSYELFIRAKYIELQRTGGKEPSVVSGLSVAEGLRLPAAATSIGTALDAVSAIGSIASGAPVETASDIADARTSGLETAVEEPPLVLGEPDSAGPLNRLSDAHRSDAVQFADTLRPSKLSPRRVSSVVSKPIGEAPAPHVKSPAASLAPRSNGTVRKESSPWSLMENLKRAAWMFASVAFFRLSFHNWYGWRRWLLRQFGAKLGRNVRIRPTTLIEMPWNLELADDVIIGDYAILYSLGKIQIGKGTVVSQYAHLCAGTHDYTSRRFPLLRPPITIGSDVWIAADAFVGPGVTVGDRAVVGARATIVKDVLADQVVVGPPATFLKTRVLND